MLPAEDSPNKVSQVSSTRTLHDVYMPLKLFNKHVEALLDIGCDTPILGACLLSKGIQIKPTTNHLLTANGTKIPLLGKLKMKFKVAGHEHTVFVTVTEAVDEFILGIDFLSAARRTLSVVAFSWDMTGCLLGSTACRINADMSISVKATVCLQVCGQKFHCPSPGRIYEPT